MENTNYRPLPPPRNKVTSKCTKKKPPVPLPRKNVNVHDSDLKNGSSLISLNFKETNVLSKKNFKPEIKMESENGLERKKSIIENTRSMSICIEKSFRSLLPRPTRRHTISQTSEDFKPDISESPVDNDIFSTLSFDSPIPSDSNSDRSFSNYYSESDFCSSQPPNFPPPPLPQDVLYDKVPRSSNSSSQCGSYSTENIYELILIGQTKSQAYENWNPTSEKSYSSSDTSNINNETKHNKSDNDENLHQTSLFTNKKIPNDTKSVVLQFDPLHNSIINLLDKQKEEEDCSLLQEIDEILYSSHYSTVESRSVVNLNLEDLDENLYTIPEPPDRLDSIEEPNNSLVLQDDNINKINCKEDIQVEPVFEEKPRKNSLTSWLSMKRTLKKVADGSTGSVRKMKSILKPEEKIEKEDNLEVEISNIFHSGILFVSIDEKNKDFEKKWCQIVGGQFKYSTNKNQTGNSISLSSLLSIQTINEPKQSEGEDIFCFKIKFLLRPQSILFGALCTTERLVWMQKFLGSVTGLFPLKISSEFSRAGYATLKEGINGEWKQAWLLLHNRVLTFAKQTCGPELVDLRKVRNVVTQEDEELKITILVVDYITKSIYLKFDEDSEILNWQHIIKAETVNTSPHLKDQQLSTDQVPVIVEKCLKFIYAHGCLTEGVYRRSGSCSNTTKLLSAFRKDAWAVQFSQQDYSVYDVASVLKRFFRDLPEPVLTTELHTHFCNAVKCNCSEDEKVILYRSLLERLPAINYVTVRKLLSHLYYIQLQNEKNLMTVQNLASIWGPTLMHIEDNDSLNWSKVESEAVNDLILLYPKLFYVEEDEIKREDRIMEALIQYNLSNGNVPQPSKPSGDLKIWIYLGSKDSENCVNVTLSPSKTALMICDELANKMGARGGYLLGLQEVVCNGTMIRPIHHTELLLDIVLLWAYWDVKYRKENYIVCLQPNSLLIEIVPFAKEHLTICAELKFAEQKSKSFKSYLFEISDRKLICYKDKSGSTLLYEWFIKDLIWYIGFEPKRNPHARWCITFILKNDLPKELRDNFGWSIAGTTKEDHLRWMAALLLAEYEVNQITPPVTINLLDY
ncbi:arf-GAP with Rho-GAP domain, ANK repeat and PH domain-containing protein 2 [Rhopalosiphum maidis]|uniref:arf-GAP with Rho-GAP domain, ANK repeat and PH domain-containing protein 2 n=1 Tax=Rhopalosiphum maidis TaxID=43146 RepID=UPI000EFDD955|nr:arf-GAP with Rho-GAP domain, ANK repeat and PH domain-containing protein 2 [Rhopalosiphum maidis]XP_026806442.1 arf-GAP with Rho-GAP domain, ANK repeat and PH domain-containing protein 2 [Rhopalosiphum maidis]XP_026806443.1 arf-GAP with Rho-GAP domain, ANK repeat and PH domain-containing protein 2 [Rhopalosiphum maidis]XP_026806444.1 arf-GAP with Rho-GAP domain, ANK repeat and PH domain-containing protein 2 [Rhopalosiphum maidis]